MPEQVLLHFGTLLMIKQKIEPANQSNKPKKSKKKKKKFFKQVQKIDLKFKPRTDHFGEAVHHGAE